MEIDEQGYTPDDYVLMAKIQLRADELAYELGPGWFVLQHHPDLGAACHFTTTENGGDCLQISRRGREAFERIVREAIGEPPKAWEDKITFRVPTAGNA